MTPLEVILLVGLLSLAALGALLLWAALQRNIAPGTEALGRGRFHEALTAADTGGNADRRSLWVAAVAARHLLEFEASERYLRRLLSVDPKDGEALLDLGLVLTYAERYDEAESCFMRALALRSDLQESITLHRAVVALRRGRPDLASQLFEEVEIPLETKLRIDLGEGEPLFCEWFLHCSLLWGSLGERGKARWALAAATKSAPASRLPGFFSQLLPTAVHEP